MDKSTEYQYLIEITNIGSSLKITAIDPMTMTEVSIIAPQNINRFYAQELAVRKLIYVLNKD